MIKVNTQTLEATREAIPAALIGLDDETLSNLQSELNPVPDDFKGMEWWPEVITDQTLTNLQKFGDEILAANDDKTVSVSYEVLDKTTEEIAADLVDMKVQKKAELNEVFNTVSERPIVDTGLGFFAQGGYRDIENIRVGIKLKSTKFRDTENVTHIITTVQLSGILDTIEANGAVILNNKWTIADQITAATNQEELDAININEGW